MTQPHDNAQAATLPPGYYTLPPGLLANACQYLDLTTPPPRTGLPPAGVTLAALSPRDPARFRALFRAVGEPWLWASHLTKSNAEIAAMLADPATETVAVVRDGSDVGLLQLEHGVHDGTEIVYFGLVPGAIGHGLGHWLMDEAIARAFARSNRLWLHTCNFDHPKALAFYLRAGFRIYATGFEIMPDPRATGLLPPTAAPHVPFVKP